MLPQEREEVEEGFGEGVPRAFVCLFCLRCHGASLEEGLEHAQPVEGQLLLLQMLLHLTHLLFYVSLCLVLVLRHVLYLGLKGYVF